MKKICMLMFGMMFVCNAYATNDIAANAESGSCTEPTLGTYSGSADLEAKWNANSVPIRWYDNHTVIQNAPNTCNYDGILTLPTPPERIGYEFNGWKVRPMMSFSTLTSLSTGGERWAKGYELSSGADYCWYASGATHVDVVNCKTDSGLNALSQKEWKVEYRDDTIKGTLYGSGYCSARGGNGNPWNTASSFATTSQLEDASGEKRYCWCQATGWQPENSDIVYANSNNISWGDTSVDANAAWILSFDDASASYCAKACEAACVEFLNYSAFRRALFVGAGN